MRECTTPPKYCAYVSSPCDKSFDDLHETYAFFVYPSEPTEIAATILEAVRALNKYTHTRDYVCWKDLHVAGRIIFCEICKAIRFSRMVVAEITNLNFNVLFEIGYAIGLGIPVLPVRDRTFRSDQQVFDQLGLFDTLGYEPYSNAADLRTIVTSKTKAQPQVVPADSIDRVRPIYLVKSPHESESSIRLQSALSAAAYGYRLFDSKETPRMTVFDGLRAVDASIGVVCHLIRPDRMNALIHNGRAAFVAGVAMARGREVLMLSEGAFAQPVDYRDIVRPAEAPADIRPIIARFLEKVTPRWEEERAGGRPFAPDALRGLNLGETAAENEGADLAGYFVETAEYGDAKRGNARLVVGRKGSGKTAIFCKLRADFDGRSGYVVVDLRPEGYQIERLRDTILSKLPPGLQGHTLAAFWTYLLLQEIALWIIRHEDVISRENPQRAKLYDRIRKLTGLSPERDAYDFAERLLAYVSRIEAEFEKRGRAASAGELTEMIYKTDVNVLVDSVAEYLGYLEEVWLLVDNLDKGWPEGRPGEMDIKILRALLDASNRLRDSFHRREAKVQSIVFVRTDVYEHLVKLTSDRGKDSAINLQWTDPEQFKRLIKDRAEGTGRGGRNFEQVWGEICEPHFKGQDSFRYILERTLGRPRDFLNFLRKAVQVGVNRGHKRVVEADITDAERSYSEDLLQELALEMSATEQSVPGYMWGFANQGNRLSKDDAALVLVESGVEESRCDEVMRRLLWFCFLGYAKPDEDGSAMYSYETGHNLAKLEGRARAGGYSTEVFEIHPGFRAALTRRE